MTMTRLSYDKRREHAYDDGSLNDLHGGGGGGVEPTIINACLLNFFFLFGNPDV